MPWQRLVVDVGLEMDGDIPAYREVICTVPRQSGKTTLILAWELHRALMWGGFQSIAYTAQTGQDARQKLIEDQYDRLVHRSPLAPAIKQVRRGMADSVVLFKNGSLIRALSSSDDVGHGKTLDLAVLDEAMAHADDRMEQGLRPTMTTRPTAQILVFSTAGTEKSVFLKRKVEAGRRAASEGQTSGICYFEWSADEDSDMDDPAEWRGWMPALGYTITEGVVAADRQGMADGEFRRAYGNLWTVSAERVISADIWNAVCRADVAPEPLMFGVDATPNRSWASIAVADKTGGELVERRRGVGWLLPRLIELHDKWDCPVAVDAGSPVGHLIEPLKAENIPVKEYGARTYAYACGSFYDRCTDGSLSIRTDPRLDDACAAATTRPLGEAWAWGRRQSDTDISPLVALTLAFDGANAPVDEANVSVMFV